MENITETILEHSCKYTGGVVCMNQDRCNGCGFSPEVASMRLQARLSKIEAAIVKHAHWTHIGSNSTGKIFECSWCKKHYNPNAADVEQHRIEEQPAYCMHCGAKMDQEG